MLRRVDWYFNRRRPAWLALRSEFEGFGIEVVLQTVAVVLFL